MEKRWDFFLTIYLRSLSKLLRSLRKCLLAKHQHFSQETLHLFRIFFVFTKYISIQQQNPCSPRNFVFSCKTCLVKHFVSQRNVALPGKTFAFLSRNFCVPSIYQLSTAKHAFLKKLCVRLQNLLQNFCISQRNFCICVVMEII